MGKVRKIKAGLVQIDVTSFVGEDGNLFFDVDTGTLRLSDGVTPGGILLAGGGGGGGIALTDLSVTTATAGTASLDYNNANGVFTYTPPDLSGYLTSYTETNDLTAAVTWANIPNANITESSVTQHQAALSITESQISDLQSYLTSYTETNDLTAAVTWTNVPDANITESSVTQHQTALSITESQISDLQAYLTSYTETNDLTAAVTWTNVPDANITESSVTQHQTALSITESQITDLASYITLGDLSIGAPLATENGGIAYNNATGTFTFYRQTYLVNEAAADNIQIGSTDQTGEIRIGLSDKAHTITIGKGNTASGTARTINIGTTGTTGSTQNINLGYANSSYSQKYIKIGNASTSVGTNSQIDMYGEILMSPGDKNNAFTIGSQTQIGTITLGQSTDDQTINIATNASASGKTKTINIGTGNTTAGTTAINIGPSSAATTTNTNIYGTAMHQGGLFEFRTTATAASTVDQVVKFAAQDAYGNYPEAGEIVVYGVTNAPSRMVIGYSNTGMTFFDGFGTRYIQPASTSTGLTSDNSVDFGSYNARWKLGRFASGTTTLSDRNEKRDIEELNEAELRVATACKGLLRKYRMIEAYETKGDGARIHFGIIAQDLDDAFTAEGLDAHRYAMFMEDTWYDIGDGVAYPSLDDIQEEDRENAVEKTKLGVRYEQVLAFIIAAI